jgi:(2R)-3-sulfolactate dehydrogenase (NADP+)
MIERLSLPDVHALARDCLTRAGAAEAVAEAVAAEIAAAEAAGERRHGMEALLRDLRLMRYGRIDIGAVMRESRPRPGLLHCDAAHGFAAAALAAATAPLSHLARQQGIALLRLDRASEPGAMIRIAAELASDGIASLAFGMTGPGRIAHPDSALPRVLRHRPRDMLAMLLPALEQGQPPDSPMGGPVSHGAWIIALDPAVAGAGLIAAGIWDAAPPPVPASEIALSAELLEQIVTA